MCAREYYLAIHFHGHDKARDSTSPRWLTLVHFDNPKHHVELRDSKALKHRELKLIKPRFTGPTGMIHGGGFRWGERGRRGNAYQQIKRFKQSIRILQKHDAEPAYVKRPVSSGESVNILLSASSRGCAYQCLLLWNATRLGLPETTVKLRISKEHNISLLTQILHAKLLWYRQTKTWFVRLGAWWSITFNFVVFSAPFCGPMKAFRTFPAPSYTARSIRSRYFNSATCCCQEWDTVGPKL